MKQEIEQVREVGSSRHASGKENHELSIGDVLRKARNELVTKRILIAIVLILLVTAIVFLAVDGFFLRVIDSLIGLVE
ncbi:MAG: hypothetical protein J6Y08_09800 [Clostridiales bacterium]|nr:hypothetical protein [Clostridiales bacterium]